MWFFRLILMINKLFFYLIIKRINYNQGNDNRSQLTNLIKGFALIINIIHFGENMLPLVPFPSLLAFNNKKINHEKLKTKDKKTFSTSPYL